MFGNCFTYLADGQAGAFFETHQKYLDIHLVLENEEAMAVTSPENVSVTQKYDKEKDIELYTGKVEQLVHLRARRMPYHFSRRFTSTQGSYK